MTDSPFTTVVAQEQMDSDKKYVPMARTRSKLMIVRPLEYQKEGFTTIHKPEGTDVVFCDIAVLDPIPPAEDEYGAPLPGFEAGEQFRRQSILQGYLKGAFKRYLGQTLIGTIYFGPREKGKPPMLWQDLSSDPACVARGQQFLATHREFLIPVEAAFVPAEPAAVPTGPAPYVAPAPAATVTVTGASWNQPDPHAQQRAASTLDQMRQMNAQNGTSSDAPPPF